jgi:hypothetical protein
VVEEGPSTLIPTLGFWLWIAGADIPVVWDELDELDDTCLGNTTLPSLKWTDYKNNYTDDDIFSDYDYDTSDDEMFWTGELEQDLSGHLRKEMYSMQTQRMLRQGRQHKAKSASRCKASDEENAGSSKVKVNRTLF